MSVSPVARWSRRIVLYKSDEPAVEVFKRCGSIRRRFYAGSSGQRWPINDVAILGGGITGLVSAYYLSRSLPKVPITLFEKSDRLGGWLNSSTLDVGTGKVVFEHGPRTLRPSVPNGLIALDLIHELGLEENLICTPKSSSAAQNRYVYFPDHLVRMPGPGRSLLQTLSSLWTEPVFKGLISGVLLEPFKASRLEGSDDESISSFITRHFGSSVADNLVSAVMHGIYAGDINELSARSILPRVWHTEQRYRSIVLGTGEAAMGSALPMPIEDTDLLSLRKYGHLPQSKFIDAARTSSVFTFRKGLGELADRLEQKLKENPNVTIIKGFQLGGYKMTGEGINAKMLLSEQSPRKTDSATPKAFSHVISTISSLQLAATAPPEHQLLPLKESKAVTVMVVNLFYEKPDLLPVRGFGYLIPRSIPLIQNPHRALGVVFDSEASVGQDTVSGTKLTIMFGGHWWQGFDTFPTEDDGTSMAKDVLKQHLGIIEEPRATKVTIQYQCIPQYTVGHDKRMAEASEPLKVYDGRLRVAGSSYTGVGVNDCIRAAKDVVKGLVTGTEKTGLETFEEGRKWMWVPPASLRNIR